MYNCQRFELQSLQTVVRTSFVTVRILTVQRPMGTSCVFFNAAADNHLLSWNVCVRHSTLPSTRASCPGKVPLLTTYRACAYPYRNDQKGHSSSLTFPESVCIYRPPASTQAGMLFRIMPRKSGHSASCAKAHDSPQARTQLHGLRVYVVPVPPDFMQAFQDCKRACISLSL